MHVYVHLSVLLLVEGLGGRVKDGRTKLLEGKGGKSYVLEVLFYALRPTALQLVLENKGTAVQPLSQPPSASESGRSLAVL